MTDLSNVKAGDKLYVRGGYSDVGRIVVVDRVTPSGRVTAGRRTFNADGRLRGGDTWTRTRAEVATQEHIDKVTHAMLADKLHRFNWEKASLAVLRQVQMLLAQGIEARQGRPSPGLDAQRESPVGAADAPSPSAPIASQGTGETG